MNFCKRIVRICTIGFATTLFFTSNVYAKSTGTVNGDNVNVRSGASTDSEVVTKYKNGQSISIKGKEGKFYIIDVEGENLYITSEFVKIVEITGSINGTVVNIREFPTTDAKVVGKVDKDKEVVIIGSTNDWVKVKSGDKVGFIKEEFVTIELKDDVEKIEVIIPELKKEEPKEEVKEEPVKEIKEEVIQEDLANGDVNLDETDSEEIIEDSKEEVNEEDSDNEDTTVVEKPSTIVVPVNISADNLLKEASSRNSSSSSNNRVEDNKVEPKKSREEIKQEDSEEIKKEETKKEENKKEEPKEIEPVEEEIKEEVLVEAKLEPAKAEVKEVATTNEGKKDAYALVTADTGLRVRSEPNTESEVLGVIQSGVSLDVLDESISGWVKVSYSGKTAYLNKEFVNIGYGEKPVKSNDLGTQIIEYGKQFLGTPYVWAGNNLSKGVDCSGFVYNVFKHFNINLNRSSHQMVSNGTKIGKSELIVGDLVFFDTTGVNDGGISHVGIYMGNGKFIHSSSSKRTWGVTISSLNEEYYIRTYVTANRVL